MNEPEAFAAHFKLMGYSPHTVECYLGVLRRFGDLDGATPLSLRAYLAERAEHVAPSTVCVDVRALRAFFKWRAETLEVEDPARTLKLPRVAEPPTESVRPETYLRLLASIPTTGRTNARDRAILAVLWTSGARLSEVARMQVTDLDLSAGTFTIPKSKGRRPRTVGLSADAVREIRRWLKYRRPSSVLWGFGPDGVRQMIERRAKALGVHVTAHQFRRGVAERWLAAGGSESLLRFHAGWESALMVKRYVRANGERLAVDEHRRLLG